MLFMEEAFVEYLWKQGIFKEKDIIGKNCLVVGGSYIVGENYAPTLRSHLLRMGALRCDNIMLFDPHFRESFCDLTDTKEAIGSLCYDVIIVLSGMEKTRNIREGVHQLQEICRPGGEIFVVARTPKDISARQEI
ncbi:MAG: class I SAM-dependent methyltransferase, partial [Centipeda sp. (in: firmicutes)]